MSTSVISPVQTKSRRWTTPEPVALRSPAFGLKLYFDQDLDAESIVPVFHRWIREGALDELAIDVTSYAHLERGPGVLLICSNAQYSLDLSEGRPALRYQRRREDSGDAHERLRRAFRKTLHAASLLADAPEISAELSTSELTFSIADRLRAPNRIETFADVQPVLSSFLRELYQAEVSVEYTPSGRPFEVRARVDAAPSVERLLGRLGG